MAIEKRRKIGPSVCADAVTPDVKNTALFLFPSPPFLSRAAYRKGCAAIFDAGPEDLEGELAFDTVSYEVGNLRLYHHDRAGAVVLFSVVKGQAWNAWGS
jgi:hypothetical protein